MPQGPFRGIAGALSRALGGTVDVTPLGGEARPLQAIFRRNARAVEIEGDVRVERYISILRARKDQVADLIEGSLVDPREGQLYRVDYIDPDTAQSPAEDGLITLVLEEVDDAG